MRNFRSFVLLTTTATLLLAFANRSLAATAPVTATSAESTSINAPTGPIVSDDATWAGVVVIVVLVGFFLAAAVIGPIVRLNMPEEVPPADSHHDSHGSDHHDAGHGATASDHGHGDHGHGH